MAQKKTQSRSSSKKKTSTRSSSGAAKLLKMLKDDHQKVMDLFEEAEENGSDGQAQEIFHADAPWAPLVHSTIVRCYSKKLHDVPLWPNGLNSFQMISKDK